LAERSTGATPTGRSTAAWASAERSAVEVAPDPARGVAYDVWRAVSDRGAYANLLLPKLLHQRRISGRDADFATELTYGGLRVQGTLDAVLARCASRPLAALDPPLLDLLRLGAYQLLYLRTPDYAAVSSSVDDAKQRLGPHLSGLVNAVLRKVARKDLAGWLDELAPADAVGGLALRHAHPAWVVAAFREALGGDLAQTEAALAADNDRPKVHLAARPGRIERDDLVAAIGGEPGRWSPYAAVLRTGDPGRVAAVRDGLAQVQDEGSQLVALALAAVPLEGPDATWLDLAAGPGGKAAMLGALAAQRGARLLAVERIHRRAGMVAGAVAGLPVLSVTADGMAPPVRPGSVDRVLVDAPCTGLGALRRRPESRWRRQPSDIPALTRLQRGLLTAALTAVRPGGVVAYVTCSPHVAETRGVVAEVLHRTDAEQLDARPYLPGMPDLGDGPNVQLWPHRHGTDAMFLALLRRP
jgi:16S rRNA (cytosine967-C5)-methyltransferase